MKMKIANLKIGVLVFLFRISVVECHNDTETVLHAKLFKSYNPDVKPVVNVSEPIKIFLRLNMMSIDNIDEKKQSFSARAYADLRWTDQFLTWEPEDYSRVSTINVPSDKIWLPDLALEDVYNRPTDLGQDDGRALVGYDGSVIIWPYKLYTVACKIKVHYYPFDLQECSLDFLSWTNPNSAMRLLPNKDGVISFSAYKQSGEWDLESYKVTEYNRPYGNDSFDHILFTFSFRRKWLFQVMNLIAPIVCISLLNITCFVVPAVSGEKVALCISMFLALAIFLTTITSFMPESSDEVSILGIYVCLQLFGSGISILCTVVSQFLHHRDSEIAISGVFLLLSKVLCQNKTETHSIKYQPQNGVGPSHVEESVTCDKSFTFVATGTSVTWPHVSRAFDRLCFAVSAVWNISLLTGLAIAYLQ